jgi:hypothetical protein
MAAEKAGRHSLLAKVVNEKAVHNFNCVIELKNAFSRAVEPR